MATTKIRYFINQLYSQGKLHPLNREVFDAFVKQNGHTIDKEKQNKVKDAFFLSYKQLLGHVKTRFILSETKVLPEELTDLIAQLKPAVLNKQVQLLILILRLVMDSLVKISKQL